MVMAKTATEARRNHYFNGNYVNNHPHRIDTCYRRNKYIVRGFFRSPTTKPTISPIITASIIAAIVTVLFDAPLRTKRMHPFRIPPDSPCGLLASAQIIVVYAGGGNGSSVIFKVGDFSGMGGEAVSIAVGSSPVDRTEKTKAIPGN
jgi:hypothetical protein